MKKIIFLIAIILGLSFIISCNEENTPDDKIVTETIEINETDITLYEGESYTFNFDVDVLLTSSNNSALIVNEKTIIAIKEGTSIVTIKLLSDERVSKEISVTVLKKVSVLEGIETKITIEEDEEYIFDIDGITLQSSDQTVVSVNGNTIKGIREGETTIKVSDDFGNYKEVIVVVNRRAYNLNTLVDYNKNNDSIEDFFKGLREYQSNYSIKENIDTVAIANKGAHYSKMKFVIERVSDTFCYLDYYYTECDDFPIGEEDIYLQIIFSRDNKWIFDLTIYNDGTVLYLCSTNFDRFNFIGKLPDDFDKEEFYEFLYYNSNNIKTIKIELGDVYEFTHLQEGAKLWTTNDDILKLNGNSVEAIKIGKGSVYSQVGNQSDTLVEYYFNIVEFNLSQHLPDTVTIKVGESYTFDIDKKIIISSQDLEIVIVEEKTITGIKEGTTYLTFWDENNLVMITVAITIIP